MTASPAPRASRHATARSCQRVRLLASLVRICRRLEKLQRGTAAEAACQDVRRRLEAWHRREQLRTSALRGA